MASELVILGGVFVFCLVSVFHIFEAFFIKTYYEMILLWRDCSHLSIYHLIQSMLLFDKMSVMLFCLYTASLLIQRGSLHATNRTKRRWTGST